jgi:16S rRNA A1518/A1519 N6-dimethyltransferase RsmA/KsgA/DIM1 with predicted DNA glycosylase/AP lyase activity
MFDTLLIIIDFILAIFLIWVVYTRAFGAEWVKVPKQARKQMLNMLALNKKDIFYDLGCGDAQLLIEASPKVKQAIGIEIDPLRFIIAKARASKYKNVKIVYGNLFKQNIGSATKIAVFLSPETNQKLGKILHGKKLVASYKWPVSSLRMKAYNAKNRVYLQSNR